MRKLTKLFLPFAVAAALGNSQPVFAISNSGKVPVLLYHTAVSDNCTYANNALKALQEDLQTLHNQGISHAE